MMQKLLSWTLQAIRDENSDFSWMEERRYEWTPLINSVISRITRGQSVLILTDDKFRWFAHYIQNKINDVSLGRPFLPFYQLGRMFIEINDIKSNQDIELLEDMLDISFPNGYLIWYIGGGDHPFTKLAYRSDDNFLWVLDKNIQNSFPLESSDELLDIKLLQLYRLFDKTLNSALFEDLKIE